MYNVAVVRVLCGYVPTQLQKAFPLGMVVHTVVSKRTNMKVCVSMRFRDITVNSTIGVSIGPSLVHCISIAMRNAQKRSKMVDCSLRGAQPPICFLMGGTTPH